jgi:hypothetical protein
MEWYWGDAFMKTMMMVVFGAVTVSASAQPTDGMKCAAFTAMDSKAQMVAIRSIAGLMPPDDRMSADERGPGKMAVGGAMSAEAVFKRVSGYCRDHPDMMIGDAMKEPMQR